MFQAKAKLIKNIEVAGNCYKIILYCPQVAKVAYPGQFLEVKVADSDALLLRRPFSIHRVKGDTIEVLFEIAGKGSEILSKRKPGEQIDIIGPLGNGFDLRLRRDAILVAGGMGVAPLIFLTEKLRAFGCRLQTKVLIGAKTKNRILCENEFKKLGCQVKIATDDGSKGRKGYVTDLLEQLLRITSYQLPVTSYSIYACGPEPMLRKVTRISAAYKTPAQVSLEAHMACGIGACLGCVVNTIDGFKRVCKDGPVFEASQVIW